MDLPGRQDELVSAVADEVLGFGPIEPLLRDASISEVMVNAADTIFYEKEGRLYLSSVRFRDDQHILRIVERIVAPLGRRVDESSPMVDARLPDGSRVNIIIPPVAPKSPTVRVTFSLPAAAPSGSSEAASSPPQPSAASRAANPRATSHTAGRSKTVHCVSGWACAIAMEKFPGPPAASITRREPLKQPARANATAGGQCIA